MDIYFFSKQVYKVGGIIKVDAEKKTHRSMIWIKNIFVTTLKIQFLNKNNFKKFFRFKIKLNLIFLKGRQCIFCFYDIQPIETFKKMSLKPLFLSNDVNRNAEFKK